VSETPRIRTDRPLERVARVTLARPEARNAQDFRMLYELDEALLAAVADDEVRVIVVAADGPDFSSGHDLRAREDMSAWSPVTEWRGFDKPGAEGYFATEQEVYVGLSWRWRNLPKPTIVAVQGRVIAGGLNLVWPFDLIVCTEDAVFSDPVTAFGILSSEYFVHPFEVGHRAAKEMLFTGQPIDAATAKSLGMVNHVVPREELESTVLDLAARIAERPSFGVALAKRAVNHALESQGQWTTLQAALGWHHLAHSHARLVHDGSFVDPAGAELIRRDARGTQGAGGAGGVTGPPPP
jgi:enoyl-CoA hydratase